MSSTRNDTSASAGSLPADQTPGNPSANNEQLLEELSIQRAVLASLLDLPDTISTKEEVAAVKAGIAELKRQLAQGRGGSYLARHCTRRSRIC